jgi:methanogenic corrinoid protein MtbC1
MRKQGEKNPKEAIIKEMSAVREAYEKGDIFIARVHMREPNSITGKPILSPYQLDEKPFSRKKVYGQIRE